MGFLLQSANLPKSEDKYVEKVFNWSEVCLSEMACYKIHTLVCHWKLLGVNQVPTYVSKYPFFRACFSSFNPPLSVEQVVPTKACQKPMTKYSISFYMKLDMNIKCSLSSS